LRDAVEQLAEREGAALTFTPVKGGYAWRLTLKKQALPKAERTAA
jgi:hypothetical protein